MKPFVYDESPVKEKEYKSGKTVTGQAFAKKFGGRCPDCFKAEREAQGGDGSY